MGQKALLAKGQQSLFKIGSGQKGNLLAKYARSTQMEMTNAAPQVA